MSEKPEIDTCPFCRHDGCEVVLYSPESSYVECKECEARGPDGWGRYDAIMLWNEAPR